MSALIIAVAGSRVCVENKVAAMDVIRLLRLFFLPFKGLGFDLFVLRESKICKKVLYLIICLQNEWQVF